MCSLLLIMMLLLAVMLLGCVVRYLVPLSRFPHGVVDHCISICWRYLGKGVCYLAVQWEICDGRTVCALSAPSASYLVAPVLWQDGKETEGSSAQGVEVHVVAASIPDRLLTVYRCKISINA